MCVGLILRRISCKGMTMSGYIWRQGEEVHAWEKGEEAGWKVRLQETFAPGVWLETCWFSRSVWTMLSDIWFEFWVVLLGVGDTFTLHKGTWWTFRAEELGLLQIQAIKYNEVKLYKICFYSLTSGPQRQDVFAEILTAVIFYFSLGNAHMANNNKS